MTRLNTTRLNTYITPPKSLQRLTGRAIADYRMIKSGDRILLGLSGGKDSLSLLHILIRLQRHAPVDFQLGVVTIDPQSDAVYSFTGTVDLDEDGQTYEFELYTRLILCLVRSYAPRAYL